MLPNSLVVTIIVAILLTLFWRYVLPTRGTPQQLDRNDTIRYIVTLTTLVILVGWLLGLWPAETFWRQHGWPR